MAQSNHETTVKMTETQEKQTTLRRLWWLLLLLLLLLSLSFSYIGYLIGKQANLDDFTGRIVDTIELDLGEIGQSDETKPVTLYQFDISGTVMYTDGTPYRNGIIELRSDVRYTITDANGNFEFLRVTEGQHTISVIEGTRRLASSTVSFTGVSSLKVKQTIQLGNGHYLIKIPLEVTVINLVLELKDESNQETIVLDPDTAMPSQPGQPDLSVDPILPGDLSPQDGGSSNPTNPTDPTNPNNPNNPTDPTNPTNPTNPTDPNSPDVPLTPTEPGTPDPVIPVDPTNPTNPTNPTTPELPNDPGLPAAQTPDRAPNMIVTDTIAPAQIWQQATAVDIFAPRDGNTGVSKIGGQTVIAPGATGRYIFKIKNPESFAVVFQINLLEEDQNFPKLPMRYRLSQGVIRNSSIEYYDWRSAQDVTLRNVTLDAKSETFYTLEWQWQDTSDSIDTAIGMQQGNPLYILDILIGGSFQ